MEEGRRFRRFRMGRGRAFNQHYGVLPLRSPPQFTDATRTRLSYTISCWYCDLQILACTEPIFRFGRRNARYLRVWFSIGVGFGATLMFVLALFLLWELAGILHLHGSNAELSKLVFGFSPTVSSLRISLVDAGFILLSTFVSVSAHEIGHIIAAASEGVQVEYLAIFIAILFPGASVAFNHESLQALQRISSLRVYCAGIWHNAVCCAICGLILLLLPSILFPFYIHGQGPMVLEVPYSSPLHGYLSPGDVLVSLDGIPIHDVQEWVEATALIDIESYQESNHTQFTQYAGKYGNNKGYCIPRVSFEECERVELVGDMPSCRNDLTGFTSTPCSYTGITDYNTLVDGIAKVEDRACCLNAEEVIKLKKCGDGWSHSVSNGSGCSCSQDESCFTPIKTEGSTWVEVAYLSPRDSPECSQIQQTPRPDPLVSAFTDGNCTRSFVYIGDSFSLSNSVHLTSYRPRFSSTGFGVYVPSIVEKMLTLTYHVSLTLALLNTLPVFFLDGGSILEVILSYCSRLSHRNRKVLQLSILAAGTLMSVLSFVRMIAESY